MGLHIGSTSVKHTTAKTEAEAGFPTEPARRTSPRLSRPRNARATK